MPWFAFSFIFIFIIIVIAIFITVSIIIIVIIVISIIFFNFKILFLMANLLQVPSSNNSEFHIIRRSMREQRRLFRRQIGII